MPDARNEELDREIAAHAATIITLRQDPDAARLLPDAALTKALDANDLAVFLRAVRDEVPASRAKWPDERALYRIAALTGEVGELAEGYLKGHTGLELHREAVQVAAMAYRAAVAILRERGE